MVKHKPSCSSRGIIPRSKTQRWVGVGFLKAGKLEPKWLRRLGLSISSFCVSRLTRGPGNLRGRQPWRETTQLQWMASGCRDHRHTPAPSASPRAPKARVSYTTLVSSNPPTTILCATILTITLRVRPKNVMAHRVSPPTHPFQCHRI